MQPFAIFNTNKHNKPGMHWWTFMDIHHSNNLLLFDSLGLDGFKFFIVDNDENIIDELLNNFRKCKVSITNQKLTLCTMKFSINNWEKLAYTKNKKLTDTAQFFFHLLTEFSKLKKTKGNEHSYIRTCCSRNNWKHLWFISFIFL